MDTELAALNGGVLIIEVVIAVLIVALLVGIVLSNRRKKMASAPKPAVELPNYYADLQQQPSGRPDPFGRFAAAPYLTGTGTPASTPSAPNPVFAAPGSVPFAPGATYPGSLDLAASTPGSPEGGVYAPAGPPQGLAATWPSDPWSPGAPGGFHADVHALDPQPAAPVTVVPAPSTPSPPPGTPAGWLPDPGGSPDTLRYWDGSAWTHHFAQRS